MTFVKRYIPWNKGKKGIMPEPWNKGKKLTEKHRLKLSLAKKGKKLSEAHKKRISEGHKGINHNGLFKKGMIPWNKGLKTGRVPKTAFKKGQKPWNSEIPEKKYICQNPECGKEFWDVPSANRQFCSIECKLMAMPVPKGSGYGKGSYCLKGHWVRSTWERAVADWLFEHGVEYNYEPKRFCVNGFYYIPDFYLLERGVWLEVKGYWTERSREKIKLFRENHSNLVVIDKSNFHSFDKILEQIICD